MASKFWIGYILFFIFIFPMFFEYIPGTSSGLNTRTSPLMAIFYLLLGVILWSCFISLYYRGLIKPLRKEYANIRAILDDGLPIVAHIESKIIEKEKTGLQVLDLEISFKNLNGTMVHIPYEIRDPMPEKNRFQEGEFLRMRIDPQLRAPTILPEDIMLDRGRQPIPSSYWGFVGLIAFCVLYLVFTYWLQSQGAGWRFLHFFHPWLTIPFFGLSLGWIVLLLPYEKPYGGLGASQKKDVLLLFKGLSAKAQVLRAEPTGTSINDQPEIRFTVEYLDKQGNIQRCKFKKIVSLINLHKIGQQEIEILYDPNKPSNVIFAEEYLR